MSRANLAINSSDVSAFLKFTKRVVFLNDGEMVVHTVEHYFAIELQGREGAVADHDAVRAGRAASLRGALADELILIDGNSLVYRAFFALPGLGF